MEITHNLLKRQIKRHLCEEFEIPPLWEPFLTAVEESYTDADMEREMLERTLELSSQELFEANSQMRAVFESIPDLLFRLNLQGTILDYKTGMGNEALLPATENLIGHQIQDIILTQIGDSFAATLNKVSRDKTVITLEYNHTLTDAETGYYEIRLTPLLESQVVAIVRNITDRKRAEHERKRIEIQIRNLQKMESIGHLAAGIAHEINTPTQYVGDNTKFFKDSFECIREVLTAYQKLHEATKARSVDATLIESLDRVIEQADLAYRMEQIPQAIHETLEGIERVTKIVRSMKEFSHPGGKEKSAANLNSAIESTVAVARSEWKYVADVALELEPDLPPVLCYVGEFNQVILNLVINAAHAIGDVVKDTGARGTITVTTRRAGDFVEIRVSDTGTGIPEEIRSRVFEPFFTTKEVGRGTGQGLSVAYNSIVQQHGGTINFISEMGRGTQFIIRLPILQTAKQ